MKKHIKDSKRTFEFIRKVARRAYEMDFDGDKFISGANGPYGDQETPIRNNAHWLCTLSFLYNELRNSDYYDLANKICDYLIVENQLSGGYSYICRKGLKKDAVNGLIGQAWAMEGLLFAANYLNRQDAYELAKSIALSHQYDWNCSLWRRCDPKGLALSVDTTFNHQLWFAAILSHFDDPILQKRLCDFLGNTMTRVKLYPDGVIRHHQCYKKGLFFNKTLIKNNIKYQIQGKNKKKSMYLKSVGYHAFNLYAMAILYERYSKIDLWKSNEFSQLSKVLKCRKFEDLLNVSEYSWQYNPPGFEIGYFYEVTGLGDAYSWINYNIDVMMKNNIFEGRSKSDVTLRARVYELVRLKSMRGCALQ